MRHAHSCCCLIVCSLSVETGLLASAPFSTAMTIKLRRGVCIVGRTIVVGHQPHAYSYPESSRSSRRPEDTFLGLVLSLPVVDSSGRCLSHCIAHPPDFALLSDDRSMRCSWMASMLSGVAPTTDPPFRGSWQEIRGRANNTSGRDGKHPMN